MTSNSMNFEDTITHGKQSDKLRRLHNYKVRKLLLEISKDGQNPYSSTLNHDSTISISESESSEIKSTSSESHANISNVYDILKMNLSNNNEFKSGVPTRNYVVQNFHQTGRGPFLPSRNISSRNIRSPVRQNDSPIKVYDQLLQQVISPRIDNFGQSFMDNDNANFEIHKQSPLRHALSSEDYAFSLKQKNIELQHLIYALKSERARINLETNRKLSTLTSQVNLLTQQHDELLQAHNQLGIEHDKVKDRGFQLLQEKELSLQAEKDLTKLLRKDLKSYENEIATLRESVARLETENNRKEEAIENLRSSYEERLKLTNQDLNERIAFIQQEKDLLRMQLSEKDILMSQDFRNRSSAIDELKLRHKEYTDQLLLMIESQSGEILHLKQQLMQKSESISDLQTRKQELTHQVQELKLQNSTLRMNLENNENSYISQIQSIKHENQVEHEKQVSALREEFEQKLKDVEIQNSSQTSNTKKIISELIDKFMDIQFAWGKSILDVLSNRNTRIHSLYTKVELCKQSRLKMDKKVEAIINDKQDEILYLKHSLKSINDLLSTLKIENDDFITLQKKMLALTID